MYHLDHFKTADFQDVLAFMKAHPTHLAEGESNAQQVAVEMEKIKPQIFK